MKVKVTADVVIQHNGKQYAKGEEFSVKENELSAIERFVEAEEVASDEKSGEEPKAETSELTVNEIKALLDEAGREYPKTAKKEELLELLNG